MRTFKSKPTLRILEAVYFTNLPKKTVIEYYLIKGDWKLKDLQVIDKQLLYQGQDVCCPYIEMPEDWAEAESLTEKEIDELEMNEEVDALRFSCVKWDDMFHYCDIDDISVEPKDKFKVIEVITHQPSTLYKIPDEWDVKDISVEYGTLYYKGEMVDCPAVEIEGELSTADIKNTDDYDMDNYFDCE